MDATLKELCRPGAGLCGWSRSRIDRLVELRNQAERDEIGYNEWLKRDGELRRRHPQPDKAKAKRLLRRVDRTFDSGRCEDGEALDLLDLRDRLRIVVGAVPSRRDIEAQLEAFHEPLAPAFTGALRERVRSQRPADIARRQRWQRELASGRDESSLVLTDADRAVLDDVHQHQLLVVAEALARDGMRPLQGVSEDVLRAALLQVVAHGDQEALRDRALMIAEWLMVVDETDGSPTHVDELYRRVEELYTFSRWALGYAGVQLIAVLIRRWRPALDKQPSRVGLRGYGWSARDAREIFAIVEAPDRSEYSYRGPPPKWEASGTEELTTDGAVAEDGAASERAAAERASVGSRLAGTAACLRQACVLLQHPPPLWGRRADLASRPELSDFSLTEPRVWAVSWWAAHVLTEPAVAPSCLDPAYLRQELGAASVSLLVDGAGTPADALRWSRDVLDLVADRARLPERILALPERDVDHDVLRPTGLDPVAAWTGVDEDSWDRQERIEEVFCVPHLVAEAYVESHLGHDLGPAVGIPDAALQRYLVEPYASWPATRLARARRRRGPVP